MFRSLYLSLVYALFLCTGAVAPFVLGLGYVWVDTFTPQQVAYSILTEIPVSEIMAIAAVAAYVLRDRRAPPGVGAVTIVTVLMGLWVTYTTLDHPVAGAFAMDKWDWAIKTIIFSVFMPFLFRSRVQIEAFLQIYMFSLAAEIVPFAAKTIISGGSYGTNLGLISGNAGLAEGSHLSTDCMLLIPIVVYLYRHSILLPRNRLFRAGYIGMVVACVAAAVGTFERTALIGVLTVAAGLWVLSRRKVLWGGVGLGIGAMITLYLLRSGGAWVDRMMTILSPTGESSAHVRLLVWRWTLDFVQEHPFGGGFNAYAVNTITLPGTPDHPDIIIEHGRAFHSCYFEMLGEHGWPGLGLYLALFVTSFLTLRTAARVARSLPDMEWCHDLARMLQVALIVPLTCGAFIGISFQSELYYMFALSVMVRHQVRSVQRGYGRLNRPLHFTLEPGPLDIAASM